MNDGGKGLPPVPPPPPSTVVWYLKMNDDGYLKEAKSGIDGTKEGTITNYDSGGKFGGYSKFAQGGAIKFDGAVQADAFRLNLQEDWTIEFYFKPSNSTSGYVVMSWSDLGYQTGDQIGIGIWYNAGQTKWQVEIYSKSGGIDKIIWEYGLVSAPPNNSSWTQIRVGYDASSNKLRLARNADVFEVMAGKDPSLFPNLTVFGSGRAPFFRLLSSAGENSLDNVCAHSADMINDDTANVEPTGEYSL